MSAHCLSKQIAALAFAVAVIAATAIAVATPVKAGSGCAALLKAAKKGYRGDPAALRACQLGSAGGRHAARVTAHSFQSRDKLGRKAIQAYRTDDKRTKAMLRSTLRAHGAAEEAHRIYRRQQIDRAAGNLLTILRAIEQSGGH
jgi:hypothetical protein